MLAKTKQKVINKPSIFFLKIVAAENDCRGVTLLECILLPGRVRISGQQRIDRNKLRTSWRDGKLKQTVTRLKLSWRGKKVEQRKLSATWKHFNAIYHLKYKQRRCRSFGLVSSPDLCGWKRWMKGEGHALPPVKWSLLWLFCFIFVFVQYNKQLNNLDRSIVTGKSQLLSLPRTQF